MNCKGSLLMSILLNIFNFGFSSSVYSPNSVEYIYPEYTQPQGLVNYPNDLIKNYVTLEGHFNGVIPYNSTPGFSTDFFNSGFGISSGYMYHINESLSFVGFSVGFDYLGKAQSNNSVTSFQSYSVLLPFDIKYMYRLKPEIELGLSAGVAYGLGFNTSSQGSINNHFYNNILPSVGGSIAYGFSSAVYLKAQYKHYFGGWTKPSYLTTGGFPSADILSVGLEYEF